MAEPRTGKLNDSTGRPTASGLWQRAQSIFLEALDVSPDRQNDLIEERCAGDAALLAEVRSLLEAHNGDEGMIGHIADRSSSPLISEPEVDRVGPYRIVRQLGEGGMGTVYLAERDGGDFTQMVAIKLIRADYANPIIEERLRSERRILALLEHPNIARMIDGGSSEDGRPYIAMEYVGGSDICTYANDRRLNIRERVDLFCKVCEAVMHAHQQSIVHRDLKPNNILITPDGQPKLLDFGIAKVLDPEATRSTNTGIFFTPGYAAPEQVGGGLVSTLSDIYALGVVLYELLVGVRPIDFGTAPPAMIRQIMESAVVPTLADQLDELRIGREALQQRARERNSTIPQLRRAVRGDLQAIIDKSLAKAPAHRYQSAGQLQIELRRFIDDEPVLARRQTPGYRMGKFVRRNRAASIAILAAALAVFGGAAIAVWQANRAIAEAAIASMEKTRAEEEAAKANMVTALMVDLFELSDPSNSRGDAITAREVLDRGTERIEQEFTDQPDLQADIFAELARVYANLGLLSRAENLIRRSVFLNEQVHGVRSLKVTESLSRLGEILAAQGKRDEAIRHLSRAESVRDSLLTRPDTVLASIRTALGWQVRESGQHDRAAALFESALNVQRAALGDQHPDVAESMLGLAAALHDFGRFDDAEQLFVSALRQNDSEVDSPHPMAATALLNIGMIRRLREQYRESEPMLRSALDMRRTLYGEFHPSTLEATEELATLLTTTGRYAEAIRLVTPAIDSATSRLDSRHPTIQSLRRALAESLYRSGRYSRARPLLDSLLSEARLVYDRGSAQLTSVLVRNTDFHLDLGETGRARTLLAEASGALEAPSIYSMLVESRLGRLELEQGKFADAKRHLELADSIATSSLRPNHRYALYIRSIEAKLALAEGRPDAARATLNSLLTDLRRSFPAPHPWIGETLVDLAEASPNDPDLARGYLQEARTHLGELAAGHPVLDRAGRIARQIGIAAPSQP